MNTYSEKLKLHLKYTEYRRLNARKVELVNSVQIPDSSFSFTFGQIRMGVRGIQIFFTMEKQPSRLVSLALGGNQSKSIRLNSNRKKGNTGPIYYVSKESIIHSSFFSHFSPFFPHFVAFLSFLSFRLPFASLFPRFLTLF